MFPFIEQRTGLAVACLLLCHGVFGALHLFSGPLASSALVGEHVAHHSPPGEHNVTGNGDHTEQHHVDAAYFAVLLGLLVGGVPNLPRGPTAPLLQVLRL